MMKRLALVVLVLAFNIHGARAQTFAMISPAAIAAMPEKASSPEGRYVIHVASDALARDPVPLPRLHTEGTLPHQGIYDQSVAAGRDLTAMRDLGLAYRLSGEKKYRDAATRFLAAWLDTYRISLNPIDETGFDSLILASDLTRDGLSPDLQDKLDHFLRDMAVRYLDAIADEQKEDVANWQSHRIKLITLAAYALGDPPLIAKARAAFQRQIQVNVNSDGSVVDFTKRDALHYVTYDLEPLLMAASAAQAHGEDWFHPAAPPGGSLQLAVDWLVPFAAGLQTHEEFVHSTIRFDAERAQAGLPGYSGPWDPKGSILVYSLATVFDPAYQRLLERLQAHTDGKLPYWVILALWK